MRGSFSVPMYLKQNTLDCVKLLKTFILLSKLKHDGVNGIKYLLKEFVQK